MRDAAMLGCLILSACAHRVRFTEQTLIPEADLPAADRVVTLDYEHRTKTVCGWVYEPFRRVVCYTQRMKTL